MVKVDKGPEIPILYLYIYRNIKHTAQGRRIISTDCFVESLRKVIYKAPSIIYREIANELIALGLLEQQNKSFYILKENQKIEKYMNKLRDYVFPINIS